jgi:hypothetical protein
MLSLNVFEIHVSGVSPTFGTSRASAEKFRQSRCSYVLVFRFGETNTLLVNAQVDAFRVRTASSVLVRFRSG